MWAWHIKEYHCNRKFCVAGRRRNAKDRRKVESSSRVLLFISKLGTVTHAHARSQDKSQGYRQRKSHQVTFAFNRAGSDHKARGHQTCHANHILPSAGCSRGADQQFSGVLKKYDSFSNTRSHSLLIFFVLYLVHYKLTLVFMISVVYVSVNARVRVLSACLPTLLFVSY